jgi:peptidoglycan/LPS O-acetylase OafA/YrhL
MANASVGGVYHRAVNTRGRRRWVLPLYVVMLAIWVLALVVSFAVFDGPTSPVSWGTVGVVSLMLVVLIVGEVTARGERH